MQTVQVTLNVPKESKEVIDAAIKLFEDIRAKKDVGAIAGENLPSLMAAFDGYDQIDDEVKSANRSDLFGYSSKELMDALLPVKSEEPAA